MMITAFIVDLEKAKRLSSPPPRSFNNILLLTILCCSPFRQSFVFLLCHLINYPLILEQMMFATIQTRCLNNRFFLFCRKRSGKVTLFGQPLVARSGKYCGIQAWLMCRSCLHFELLHFYPGRELVGWTSFFVRTAIWPDFWLMWIDNPGNEGQTIRPVDRLQEGRAYVKK